MAEDPNKTNTAPASVAADKGATTPPTAAADSKPVPTWKGYILPALAVGTLGWFIGVPVLGGLAAGVGGKYLWNKWRSRAANVG